MLFLPDTSVIKKLLSWSENSAFHGHISLGRYLFSVGALYRLIS